jgi:hypothetical protein
MSRLTGNYFNFIHFTLYMDASKSPEKGNSPSPRFGQCNRCKKIIVDPKDIGNITLWDAAGAGGSYLTCKKCFES